jgi:F-type H+-transporting ATPase subunit delta
LAVAARSKHYAQAVFQIAQQTGEYDKWLADLGTLSSLKTDDVFFHVLETPTISNEDKGKLIRERFAGISAMAVNLMSLLVEKRIINILPGILTEFQTLVDAHLEIDRAEVITAVQLDEAEKGRLEERLGIITGKKVIITTKVDPSLIGGILARLGGKLLDGSTRSRLEALRKDISQIAR